MILQQSKAFYKVTFIFKPHKAQRIKFFHCRIKETQEICEPNAKNEPYLTLDSNKFSVERYFSDNLGNMNIDWSVR